MNDDQALHDFVAKYARPYDPASDDYDRPPFAADIKEGKNDPIYNAHSYHTKVPPRGILSYILHYTKPGDLILDPFCGSGMTGVAALMCANPPADLLQQFPELKDRVGPRRAILNDLSPAACHIAYNYTTPVDVAALKREFERIKVAVKDEFEWLYGTEHYEPAVGLYIPENPSVAERLKNTPSDARSSTRIFEDGLGLERTWELIDREEAERRLGYPVTELPPGEDWGALDVSKVDRWVCIPAMIQYTIWSDVYGCEGFVTVEEPTGKISKRGRNSGKLIVHKRRVLRGCRKEINLWDTAVDRETGKVADIFVCPHCGQPWKKLQLTRISEVPVETLYAYRPLPRPAGSSRLKRHQRRLTLREAARIQEIERSSIPYWYPDDAIDMGREMLQHGLQKRGSMSVSDFFFKRQLWALGRLWKEFALGDERVASMLRFLFTSLHQRYSKRTKWHISRFGQCSMPNTLYIPSLMVENNVIDLCINKFSDLHAVSAFVRQHSGGVFVRHGCSTELNAIQDSSVDYVFADPPFGQNIYYADCSLLWEGWLQQYTDESKEIVVSERRNGGLFKNLDDYERLMQHAFAQMFRVLKPGRWATIEFNNSDGAVFNAIKSAVKTVGFEIVNMLLLDKNQKSFKQIQGANGEADVVDKDVLFNLRKPAVVSIAESETERDLDHQVADAVREYLRILPSRIQSEPAKYTEDHRTTATINSMLMNTLIPRGVNVDQLNLPFIERVCSRYFRKVGQRWYLRGEAVSGDEASSGLIEEEVAIKGELSAIEWIRQHLKREPALIGELKPMWMRATGLLLAEVSQSLVLVDLLVENFWRDADTNRWREPTNEERERMNDDRSLRVLHDADRFAAGTLRRATTDAERCEWIEVLFKACEAVEDNEGMVLPTLRGFDSAEGYRLIGRLFQSVLREKVAPAVYTRADKQTRVASQRLSKGLEAKARKVKAKRREDEEPTLFDVLGDT